MHVRLLLAAAGAVQVINACVMLAVPASWHAWVPGVAMTGPFNAHFVGDIGFALLASGVSLMPGRGAVWPALHGLFHVYGWITAGFPTEAEAAAVEGSASCLPARSA